MNHAVPAKRNSVNLRLAKSILLNEGLPNDCLSVSPIQLFEKLTQLDLTSTLAVKCSSTDFIKA